MELALECRSSENDKEAIKRAYIANGAEKMLNEIELELGEVRRKGKADVETTS